MLIKAIVCTRYGAPDVLRLMKIDAPTPAHDEVRVRVRATAVTSSDCVVEVGRRVNPPFQGGLQECRGP